MRWAVLTVAAALVPAGCGDDAEPRVRATLDAHARALAAQDWDRYCALMTAAAQRELLRYAPPGTTRCQEAFAPPSADGFGVTAAVLVQELGPLEEIDVHGDTAEARYERSVTDLRKVGDRWLID